LRGTGEFGVVNIVVVVVVVIIVVNVVVIVGIGYHSLVDAIVISFGVRMVSAVAVWLGTIGSGEIATTLRRRRRQAFLLEPTERERERERERDIPRAGAALANDGGALAMIAFKAVPGVAAEAA